MNGHDTENLVRSGDNFIKTTRAIIMQLEESNISTMSKEFIKLISVIDKL